METNLTNATIDNGSGSQGIASIATNIVYVMMGLLGVFGNALVLIVIILIRDLHDVANILIGNQSLIDLLTSVLLLASFVAPPPPLPSINPTLARFICAFWNSKYPFWSLIVASSLNLTLMTLERYYAIIFPIHYHSRRRSTNLKYTVTLPWLSGFAYQQYLAWFTNVDQNQCFKFLFPSEAAQRALTFGGTFLELLLPLTVMVYVYSAIYIKLKSTIDTRFKKDGGISARGTQPEPKLMKSPRITDHRARARGNVIKMMLTVSACYIICWLPNQFLYWAHVFGLNVDLNGLLYTLSVFVAFGNMWVNPFIYSFRYRRFQRGLRKVFRLEAVNMTSGKSTMTTEANSTII